jgi:hypothetical protein
MKKTITKLAILVGLACNLTSTAQTVSFDTFTLSTNSYYKDTTGADFSANGVTFRYHWNTSWDGWESGSAYTNVLDTANGSYTNLYGCIPGTAFGGNNYATVQSGAVISFSNNTTAVSGFYITNTTYAWKEIKKGGFGRKFGDTTGTGSGTSIPQGQYPDWFKILVKGYRGGNLLTDSVEFYLADYRGAGTTSDYVVKNWQYVNCISLGQVDSLTFEMKSSDNNAFGMKTPAFFSMDNFTIQSTVGIEELTNTSNIFLFPNPTNENLFLNFESNTTSALSINVYDISGKNLQNNTIQTAIGRNQVKINTELYEAGIYLIELKDGFASKKIKFIKL